MKQEQPMEKPIEPKDELVEAQIKLQQAHQKKVQNCSKELADILNKYGFELKIEHIINLVPKQ